MYNASYTDWAIVIFIFGLLGVYGYFLGVQLIQIGFRVGHRKNRDIYEKWDVASELFRPDSLVWFTAWTIAIVAFSALLYLFAYGLTATFYEDSAPLLEVLYYPTLVTVSAWVIGIVVEDRRIDKTIEAPTKLDNLPAVFHQTFTISELLSMHEALRHAPDIFWKEYASLPDDLVNGQTNRDYRERASLFRHRYSIRHNNILISLAILGLILTAFALAKEVLW